MSRAQQQPRRLIIGISGATGIIFGVRALKVLRELSIETHLVVSRAGDQEANHELQGKACIEH